MKRRICYNGVYCSEEEPVLLASNKSYRYGDGFFETIKVINGKIFLASYHKQRIENSISLLGYTFPIGISTEAIFSQIVELCKLNDCLSLARVRLSFSNGEGGLSENELAFHYLIEAWPLNPALEAFSEAGLVVGFFPLMKKNCDEFSNLKSASALLFSQAARFSKEKKWDDCVVLNIQENICESSIANLFWVKDSQIYTPALTEGCVAGVMRAYLIDSVKEVIETTCTQTQLLQADEVFFTNAIRGIRWVKSIETVTYNNHITRRLCHVL